MITINIYEEVPTRAGMAELLKHIAKSIEIGYISLLRPHWELEGEEEYLGLNGEVLKVGDEVEVPYPSSTDVHSQEFNGVIDSFIDGSAIIVDGDGDYFDIEPERLTKVNNN